MTPDQRDMVAAVSEKQGCVEVIPEAGVAYGLAFAMVFFENPGAIALVYEDADVRWLNADEIADVAEQVE